MIKSLINITIRVLVGFKYLYLSKNIFYVRGKVIKRAGIIEMRLCLHTHKLDVAIVVLEKLLPIMVRLKQLVLTL